MVPTSGSSWQPLALSQPLLSSHTSLRHLLHLLWLSNTCLPPLFSIFPALRDGKARAHEHNRATFRAYYGAATSDGHATSHRAAFQKDDGKGNKDDKEPKVPFKVWFPLWLHHKSTGPDDPDRYCGTRTGEKWRECPHAPLHAPKK